MFDSSFSGLSVDSRDAQKRGRAERLVRGCLNNSKGTGIVRTITVESQMSFDSQDLDIY